MWRDPLLYLDDMIEASERVLAYAQGFERDAFLGDRKTCDATVRNLQILGEAAKKIPDNIRVLAAEIPWRRVCGMRDVLTHDYFGIDERILWDVVSVEVPRLLPKLVALRAGIAPAEN